MARNFNTKSEGDLPDEDTDVEPTPGASNVLHEQTVSGQKIRVMQGEPGENTVAPSPGSDRTPGEPTPSKGSSDGVVITVPADQAEALKVILSQLSVVGGPGGLQAAVEQFRQASAQQATTQEANRAALDGQEERLKKTGIDLRSALTPQMALQELRTRDKLQAKALAMDVSPVGGRYLRSDGTAVNANGDVIAE